MCRFPHTGAAAHVGTLIIARTETCPRDQVGGIRKARHVSADLGKDDLGGHVTHAGDSAQQADTLPDRRQRLLSRITDNRCRVAKGRTPVLDEALS
jgi:hypothetical protein